MPTQSATGASTGTRLDVALVELGLARSRTHAQTLIAAGHVTIDRGDGRGVDLKASLSVAANDVITVNSPDAYVGRAARKLAGALERWPGIRVEGRVCLDAGASTGGFTQVLLDAGAATVYAVDVGHDQLASSIAGDPRVHNVEGVNLRTFSRGDLPNPGAAASIDLVVGDLSFISLTLVVPQLVAEIGANTYVLLVKPQFEVGRQALGHGGVVTDPIQWEGALSAVIDSAIHAGLTVNDVIPSQVAGGSGNREFFLWLQPTGPSDRREWKDALDLAIAEARHLAKGDAQ